MKILNTKIPNGPKILVSKTYKDNRGFLRETFNKKIITALDPEPYSLQDASVTHDILESRRGGGSLLLKP